MRIFPRWSLRATVALAVVGVVVAPLVLVAGWLGVERQMESAMRENAVFTAQEAAQALTAPPALATPAATTKALSAVPLVGSSVAAAPREGSLTRIARQHRVRVRLLDEQASVMQDENFDNGRDLSERAGGVVLRRASDGDNDSEAADRGPESLQADVREALAGGETNGCSDFRGSVVCYAAKRVSGHGIVHVQDSAERPLPLLYALRFQLGRITMVVLPFALLLALWVGSRLVGPLETLRDQVLAKVREPRPVPNLRSPENDETAQLAQAFNTLLERLAERRRENEAFVADLVHEFKNPVATIRACGESLASTDVTPERAQRLARLVHDSTTRLDALVTQFLELAHAEAGMLQEPREELNLAALCRARVERARADERWSGVTFELTGVWSVRTRGVAERLETVVDNLLANAASFAPRGTVKVEVTRDGEYASLRVSDDGPGIATEDLPHVFERFFTTRRHDRGSGLGLALVRAVVEAHGGTVSVTSEPGRGATFEARFEALPV